MAPSDIDLLGPDDHDNYPAKSRKPKKARDLGGLHDLLMRGLPDFMDGEMFDTKRLAKRLNLSRAALYQWFKNNQLPPKRVPQIIKLSEQSRKRPSTMMVNGTTMKWAPLTRDEFWEFVSN